MKAVIYARYSSERQTEQSIEGQLRDCNEYAKQNDITVIGTYIDRAKTGRNDNRVDFQCMLRDSSKKQFDTVIVWKIDRFGRNREDIAKNKAILRRNGVRVLSAKEHIPDGAEGIILEGLLESLAEYYSVELKEKVARGMRESALKCQYNGSGLATGYTVDKEHKYHLDPEGAKVVQLIFSSYSGGMKIADIQRLLCARGIKTMKGKDFTIGGVSRILRNRQYIGEYKWKDIVVPGGMPRIISDELFEQVQAELNKNKRAPARNRSSEQVDFLLTSKLFCGHCMSTMAGDCGSSKSGKKFFYYSCRSKKLKHTCSKKSVKKDDLEKRVTQLTAENILRDDIIEFIADRVAEISIKEQNDKSMLFYFKQRLNETNTAISNIMKAIESGIFSETTGARLRELEEQRNELNIEIEKESLLHTPLSREQVIFFLTRFKGGDVNDKEYQKQLIDIFVHKVILYDDRITITYNHSGDNNEVTADIIIEAAENAEKSSALGCSTSLSAGGPEKTVDFCRRFFQLNPPFRAGEILLRNVKSSLCSGEIAAAVGGFNFTFCR